MPKTDKTISSPASLISTQIGQWSAWVAACAALIGVAGSIGGPADPLSAILLVVDTHTRAGWPAIAMLLAGIGVGRGLARAGSRVPGILRDAASIAPALGVGALLLLLVLLGTAGVLRGPIVWPLVIAGLAMLAFDLARVAKRSHATGRPLLAPPPGWLWAGLPGIAVLAVAAASPPGVLWASEYGAYDVLSYHLQLPVEWAAAGHTRPFEHNVYSFLPGAIEQSYSALILLGGSGDPFANAGAPLSAAHTLHAGLTILAAGAVAALARRLATAGGVGSIGAAIASAFAGGLVLCTPWTVVVGSLAYNEMGIVLLGSAAVFVACRRGADQRTDAAVRAARCGALVAAACLVKPTAVLFVGAPAGILLLRFARLKHWPIVVGAGGVAGAAVLSVWLVPNLMITGNPVFPLATGVFGAGHWTAEQAARFAASHAFDGGSVDRIRLLLFADPTVGEGANAGVRYRGISNTQWLLAFPAASVGILAIACVRRSRDIGIGLAMCLAAQIAAWLAFTHLQSRFLVPCLIVVGPAVGVGLGVCARGRVSSRGAIGVGAALVLLQTSALWAIYSEQNGGEPNRALGAPPLVFTGSPYDPETGRVSPIAYLNHETPSDSVVLLVGDATPLYLTRRTVYATVWDRPPVLDFAGGDLKPRPDFVLINDAELARQRESGYLNEALTAEFMDGLVRTLEPVRVWPGVGVRLYRVPSDWVPSQTQETP